jgi:hypothetical protein
MKKKRATFSKSSTRVTLVRMGEEKAEGYKAEKAEN